MSGTQGLAPARRSRLPVQCADAFLWTDKSCLSRSLCLINCLYRTCFPALARRTLHQFAVTIRTDASENVFRAMAAKRAFKRTDRCFIGIGGQSCTALLTLTLHLQHLSTSTVV